MIKKREGEFVFLLCIFFLVLILPLVSAGIFDKIFERVRQSPQNFSVTVGNSVPVVSVFSIAYPVLLPASTGPVNIVFDVTDGNGWDDIDNSTLFISLDHSLPPEQRTGNLGNCVESIFDANTLRYNCSINMLYYDAEGQWDINFSINDSAPATGVNDTESFAMPQVKGTSLISTTITFPVTFPGGLDFVSELNTTVRNEGNYEIDDVTTFLNITSQALIGQTDPNQNISGNNFSSADELEGDVCGSGVVLSEGNPISLPGFILLKGDLGTPFPEREIQYCLLEVPSGLSDQSYSTEGYPTWEIAE